MYIYIYIEFGYFNSEVPTIAPVGTPQQRAHAWHRQQRNKTRKIQRPVPRILAQALEEKHISLLFLAVSQAPQPKKLPFSRARRNYCSFRANRSP